jgi:hypothetical protein
MSFGLNYYWVAFHRKNVLSQHIQFRDELYLILDPKACKAYMSLMLSF